MLDLFYLFLCLWMTTGHYKENRYYRWSKFIEIKKNLSVNIFFWSIIDRRESIDKCDVGNTFRQTIPIGNYQLLDSLVIPDEYNLSVMSCVGEFNFWWIWQQIYPSIVAMPFSGAFCNLSFPNIQNYYQTYNLTNTIGLVNFIYNPSQVIQTNIIQLISYVLIHHTNIKVLKGLLIKEKTI